MSEGMFRPPVNRAMRVLDRAFFSKTIPTSAARVLNARDTGRCRTLLVKSKEALDLPRYSVIQPDPVEEHAKVGRKCILLKPEIRHDDSSTWSGTLQELEREGTVNVFPYEIKLNYDYWTYDEIMQSVVPEELANDIQGAYVPVGHVAHLNLREQYLPYKHLIAQVLVDKAHCIKTVINKIDDVGKDDPFRTFPYEVLAGPDDLNVQLRHENCLFEFDYSKVYWNTRLQNEHHALVAMFNEGEAICDVMAGIGPFSVPAGKQNIFSYANDLNPQSYKYLVDTIKTNKVEQFVTPFNVDGREFIRSATYDLVYADHSTVVPIYRTRQDREKGRQPRKEISLPRTFSHYVMNLPASAITFLPSFIGLYSKKIEPSLAPSGSKAGELPTNPRHLFKPFTTTALPMIHVYCFSTKSDDNVRETKAICEEISKQLEFTITPDTPELTITNVRGVAPNKCMFRASFRLPESVAFKGLED